MDESRTLQHKADVGATPWFKPKEEHIQRTIGIFDPDKLSSHSPLIIWKVNTHQTIDVDEQSIAIESFYSALTMGAISDTDQALKVVTDSSYVVHGEHG